MLKMICVSLGACLLVREWWGVVFVFFLIGGFVGLNLVNSYPIITMSEGLHGGSLSMGLILLSLWMTGLVLMASVKEKEGDSCYFFVFFCTWLAVSLILCFFSSNFMFFYFMFEVSLIPIFFLVLGWGYQPERIQAGVYMLFYTLLGSMPLLVLLLKLSVENGGSSMHLVEVSGVSYMVVVMGVLAFLMKLPMYGVHLWLPKAHVEAPVAGSMLLAGVLLKLGGYGIYLMVPVLSWAGTSVWSLLVGVGAMGGCLASFICLVQVDMKSLVAYSSVVHMGLVLGGGLVFSWWTFNGGLGIMLGHGLCSSGLFYLVNVLYSRTNSRSLLISKGASNVMPSMALWWFLFCVANMSAPPTLNLLGELEVIIGFMSWESSTAVAIACLSFMGGAYSLYLFSFSQHGNSDFVHGGVCSGKILEYHTLALHWIPLNFVILYSSTSFCGV